MAGVSTDQPSLNQRIIQLNTVLQEQKQTIEDSCDVLKTSSELLQTVRARYEPLKYRSAELSRTSTNATQCSTDVTRLLMFMTIHERLDKACQQASEGRLDELLAKLSDVLGANEFLIKHQHLAVAVQALANNRQSIAHAADRCATIFERIMRTQCVLPGSSALEAVLQKSPDSVSLFKPLKEFSCRPSALDVFFPDKSNEVAVLTNLMAAVLRADENACLRSYVAARQQAVSTMMQLVAANVVSAVPSGAKQERHVHEWSNQMRMLAQVLRWESELATTIVPEAHLPEALDGVLSAIVSNAVETGHALSSGRVSPEKVFSILDMIECMHDPFVLPSMKAAFRSPALLGTKEKFHALLATLCAAAQAGVHSFTASLTGDGMPVRKEPAAVTTIAQQTAFALRFLKSLFRPQLKGKLPFLSEPRKFASDATSALLSGLEARITAAHRDPAVLAIAMLNNVRYLLLGVGEHDQLPAVLGSTWQKQHRETVLPRWQELYLSTTWHPVKSAVGSAKADSTPTVKKDVVKEHSKTIFSKLDRIAASQRSWDMPDAKMRSRLIATILELIMPEYTGFWNAYQDNIKILQKHCKYSPDDVKSLISHLFSKEKSATAK